MTSTARQLRQPPTIEAIERVPYFADERRGPKDLEGFPKNKRRVSSLILEIHSKVNNIKRTKKTQSEDLEVLRNYKAPIRILPVYYIRRL